MVLLLVYTRLSSCQLAIIFMRNSFRPIPTEIITSELKALRDVLVTMGNDVSLLDKWYRVDMNAVPPVSVLQPITTHLIHFLNKRVPHLQSRDAGIWWGTLPKMQIMLRKASHTLYVNGKILEFALYE